MKTANLPKIKDFPARSYLYKKLGGNIRIMLDNDAHTAALAEHRKWRWTWFYTYALLLNYY